MTRPAGGADAVIPEAARLGALRLAALRLRTRGRLRIEGRVSLGPGVAIRVARGAQVVLGEGVHLGGGCRLEALAGRLRLGAGTVVGPRAFVIARAGMEVGEDCVIGEFAALGVLDGPGPAGPVTVGARSRIAAHATVASGAVLPPGTVLGSYRHAGGAPEA